ncbi:MAG: hypothetical protein Q8O00_06250 [Holophaga sp.]|nr:hypothetical protein [Holophaga sp.]
MRHLREAEKLLGGYAAGILTEDEKTVLYSAALNNQELFNALADEEALRELLADPIARQHLLSLLNHPTTKKSIVFWRRPALVGLAASLFVMVTTSVMLWQREQPTPSLPKEKAAPQPTSAVPSAAPAESKQLAGKAEIKSQAPKQTPPIGGAPPAMAPVVQPSIQRTAESLADREQPMKADAAPAPRLESKKSTVEKPQPAEAEMVGNLLAVDKSDATTAMALAKEEQKGYSASRAKAATAFAAGSAKDSRKISAPSEVMERLENGKVRLTVTRPSGDFLYLLKRTPAYTVSITPSKTIPSVDTTIDTFEFSLEAQDHLDLYLLTQPAADPRALPANNAVAGRWKRLQ